MSLTSVPVPVQRLTAVPDLSGVQTAPARRPVNRGVALMDRIFDLDLGDYVHANARDYLEADRTGNASEMARLKARMTTQLTNAAIWSPVDRSAVLALRDELQRS